MHMSTGPADDDYTRGDPGKTVLEECPACGEFHLRLSLLVGIIPELLEEDDYRLRNSDWDWTRLNMECESTTEPLVFGRRRFHFSDEVPRKMCYACLYTIRDQVKISNTKSKRAEWEAKRQKALEALLFDLITTLPREVIKLIVPYDAPPKWQA